MAATIFSILQATGSECSANNMAQEQLTAMSAAISDPHQVRVETKTEDSLDRPPEATADQKVEEQRQILICI